VFWARRRKLRDNNVVAIALVLKCHSDDEKHSIEISCPSYIGRSIIIRADERLESCKITCS